MKTLKTLSLGFILGALLIAPASSGAYSTGSVDPNNPEQVRSTMALKQYMGHFGTLVAGMEIMRAKEKKPDWDAIAITLKEMEKTLSEMQKADQAGNYKEFTSVLESNLAEVKKYGAKKDPKIYDAFDKLTNTCFNCHAAHRPSDFLIPKEKTPRMSDGQKTSYLFEKLN